MSFIKVSDNRFKLFQPRILDVSILLLSEPLQKPHILFVITNLLLFRIYLVSLICAKLNPVAK